MTDRDNKYMQRKLKFDLPDRSKDDKQTQRDDIFEYDTFCRNDTKTKR